MTHLSEKGIEALTRVAEWLEAGAPHVIVNKKKNLEIGFFDMEYAVSTSTDGNKNDCGTACCIAGAVCQFEMLGMNERNKDGDLEWLTNALIPLSDTSKKGAFYLASDYLGMDYDTARHLFEPFNVEYLEESEYNNPIIAARVVRNFIETSVVDWNLAAENVYFENN